MVKAEDVQAEVSRHLRINLFWMGKQPFATGKTYHLKLGTAKIPCRLEKINYLIDASETTGKETKTAVERHDVADCIIELSKPLAFDPIARLEATGRFVIVDRYEIAGGGIIRESLPDAETTDDAMERKDATLIRSSIPASARAKGLNQKAALILFSGGPGREPANAAQALEAKLMEMGKHAFFIGLEDNATVESVTPTPAPPTISTWGQPLPAAKLGEAASWLLDAGFLVVASAKGLDSQDVKVLESRIAPHSLIQLESPADAEEASGAINGIVAEAISRLRAQGAG
jgi:bifunctional enzyme CysN/CysC